MLPKTGGLEELPRIQVRIPRGWWLLWAAWLPLGAGDPPAAPRSPSAPPPPPPSPSPSRLRCLQVSVFANGSWARTDGQAWLGELQAFGWSNGSDAVRCLRPWARGAWGAGRWRALQEQLGLYRRSFTRDVRELVKMLQLRYPLEIQVSAGCEVRPGNTSEDFFHAAVQGEDILSFQGSHWVPAPQAPRWVHRATEELNKDQGTRRTVRELLRDTCPPFVRGLLEAGRSELEKQERPEAWLSAGPAPGPGRLQLVCHVSGFHPKPVRVTWMRGEQEQQGTQRGDVLPHADGTWYLRATLDVAAREAAGLSCRVTHSSLGGQDMVLHWGRSRSSAWLVAVAVLGSLLVIGCLGCSAAWCRARRSYQDIL